jgi:hypothetical protein
VTSERGGSTACVSCKIKKIKCTISKGRGRPVIHGRYVGKKNKNKKPPTPSAATVRWRATFHDNAPEQTAEQDAGPSRQRASPTRDAGPANDVRLSCTIAGLCLPSFLAPTSSVATGQPRVQRRRRPGGPLGDCGRPGGSGRMRRADS